MFDIPTSNRHTNETISKEELSISQLIEIFSRRKWIIFFSILLFLVLALLYNFFSTPIYESHVIAKKEETSERAYTDELKNMFSMQTLDKLETEIEIIKSGTVLNKVINELNLSLVIQYIRFNNCNKKSFDASFIEYTDYINSIGGTSDQRPRFYSLKIDPSFTGGEFFIQKYLNGDLKLYNAVNTDLIQTSSSNAPTEFNSSGINIIIDWAKSQPGDQVYFKISNMEESVEILRNMINLSGIGKTNLAKLTVKSKSPKMAQLLAMTIIEKYREVRLGQKRQTVQYSLDFVNNQLTDIKNKLENAEIELSIFKKENKIVSIDESSKDIIEFLSNLETEKVQVELELVDYQNKMKEMNNELSQKEYFDQTHLTPQRSEGRASPFSALLEQLSNMEIERLVLLQKRKENHPDVITVNKQISQIKVKLGEYNQNTLTSYNILAKTLQKKRSNLRRLIKQYSDKIEKLPEQESQLAKLTRNKNAYEKMLGNLCLH